jgi:hypothetical protein
MTDKHPGYILMFLILILFGGMYGYLIVQIRLAAENLRQEGLPLTIKLKLF